MHPFRVHNWIPLAPEPQRNPIRDHDRILDAGAKRMDELDALIAAGRGDDRPVQYRRPPKPRAKYGSVKAKELDETAASMRRKYMRQVHIRETMLRKKAAR